MDILKNSNAQVRLVLVPSFKTTEPKTTPSFHLSRGWYHHNTLRKTPLGAGFVPTPGGVLFVC